MSTDARADRRDLQNVALRAAFDELAACIGRAWRAPEPATTPVGESQANAAYLAVSACARQARRHGVPPERFLVSLKRFLQRHPELRRGLDRMIATGVSTDPREQIVTWAISAYYRAPARDEG